MLTITLKDKIWYGNAIGKRFHYTHRMRICLKHRWEFFYNLHWYLIGFISLFVYYFADTCNIRLVHRLIWNNNVSILGVHKTKRLRFLYWISQLLCNKISVSLKMIPKAVIKIERILSFNIFLLYLHFSFVEAMDLSWHILILFNLSHVYKSHLQTWRALICIISFSFKYDLIEKGCKYR